MMVTSRAAAGPLRPVGILRLLHHLTMRRSAARAAAKTAAVLGQETAGRVSSLALDLVHWAAIYSGTGVAMTGKDL